MYFNWHEIPQSIFTSTLLQAIISLLGTVTILAL